MYIVFFFFFKQKTAYEVRISDWSSDVCSSDLRERSCRHPRPPSRGSRASDGAVALDARVKPEHDGFKCCKGWAITSFVTLGAFEIGRASCRERVCQYV